MNRKYLGDGLYMEYDGFNVWLITNNGVTDTNKVALEPEVLKCFIDELVTQQIIKL